MQRAIGPRQEQARFRSLIDPQSDCVSALIATRNATTGFPSSPSLRAETSAPIDLRNESTSYSETVASGTYLYRIRAFNLTTGQVSSYSNQVQFACCGEVASL